MEKQEVLNILNKFRFSSKPANDLLPKKEGIYIYPDIPQEKLKVACSYCKVPKKEQILALIDCTLFGSAKNAVLFGEAGIYFLYSFDNNKEPQFLPYSSFGNSEFKMGEPDRIHINGSIVMGIERSVFKGEDLLIILSELKGLRLNN